MNERICNFKIIAFVDGKRKVIDCNPEEGCLEKLVWSGIGVRNAAIKMLTKTHGVIETKDIDAYADGECSLKESQAYPQKSPNR